MRLNNYRFVACFFLTVMVFAPSTIFADCNKTVAFVRSAESGSQEEIVNWLRVTVCKLQDQKVRSEDPDIPAPIRPLLTDLKRDLRNLIQSALNDKNSTWKEPGDVSARVLSILRQNNLLIKNSETETPANLFTYGEIIGIDIARPIGHPDLLVATSTIAVMCGSDTSFYVFRNNSGKWELAAEQEANGYKDISGAQEAFQFAISPISDKGDFFVVTTNVNPWCTSNWQSVRYRAFRIGKTPFDVRNLIQKSESIYLGSEDYGSINASADEFRISFDSGQWLDSGVLIRKHIVAYTVQKDRVSRIAPIAVQPEGFLDEWLHIPWEEAIKWSEPRAVTRLHMWHEKLRLYDPKRNPKFFTSFVFDPPACKTENGLWYIGVEFEPYSERASLPSDMPHQILFIVALKNGNYLLKDISISTSSKCSETTNGNK